MNSEVGTVRCYKCGTYQPVPGRGVGRLRKRCEACGEGLNALALEIVTERVHELKIWPDGFRQVKRGVRRCEVRPNDRGFKVGDILFLREWAPSEDYERDGSGEYTGHYVYVQVTHILSGEFGIPRDTAAMSISTPNVRRRKFSGTKTRKVLTI